MLFAPFLFLTNKDIETKHLPKKTLNIDVNWLQKRVTPTGQDGMQIFNI
jgi:hypothetical protein